MPAAVREHAPRTTTDGCLEPARPQSVGCRADPPPTSEHGSDERRVGLWQAVCFRRKVGRRLAEVSATANAPSFSSSTSQDQALHDRLKVYEPVSRQHELRLDPVRPRSGQVGPESVGFEPVHEQDSGILECWNRQQPPTILRVAYGGRCVNIDPWKLEDDTVEGFEGSGFVVTALELIDAGSDADIEKVQLRVSQSAQRMPR